MGTTQSTQPIYVNSKQTDLDLLSQYEMSKDTIGKGQFGTVVLGTNKHDRSQQIAIKKIRKSRLTPPEIEDLKNEILLLKQVDHPNIVKYYESYENS